MTTRNDKPKAVVSLFDYTGNMVKPWADRGYQCFIFDLQHPRGMTWDISTRIHKIGCNLADPLQLNTWLDHITHIYDVVFMSAFPPCTDLAVSGAKHFARKAAADPEYRNKAMAMVYASRDAGERLRCPYFIENPVSVISSEWRRPDFTFQPYEYGGYLPQDDVNPWFDLIPARDAYPKRTCLWTGGGFTMPVPRHVDQQGHDSAEPVSWKGYSPMFHKLGGKSLRTKNIRSATPRGFAEAVAQQYAHNLNMETAA